MSTFAILLWSLLLDNCFGQLKACYQAFEREVSGDFPCNPDANVSSCCAPGNICSSNLLCTSASNRQDYVGTCTDVTWSSPACPFNLSWCLLLVLSYTSKGYKPLITAALASGAFDPFYDKFSNGLNTTQCADGTLCPFASNQDCCDAKRGVTEIQYNYTTGAVMPADVWRLSSFYSAAGYAFPTASNMSIRSNIVQPSTSHTTIHHTLPTSIPTKSIASEVVELSTFSAATSYIFPTSLPSASGPSFLLNFEALLNLKTDTITTTVTASAVPSSAPSKTSSSLGSGIGIGIALSVAVCGVCAILLRLYMHRRPCRQRNDMLPKTASPVPKSVHGISTDMEGTPMEDLPRVYELDEGSL